MSASVTDFINAVFVAESLLKKLMPLSTVYAFRTTGARIRAHAMFLFSSLEGRTNPFSTAHYLLDNGSVLSIASLPAQKILEIEQPRAKTVYAVILDFYDPPCVIGIRHVGKCTMLIEKKFGSGIFTRIDKMFLELLDSAIVGVEEAVEDRVIDKSFAYIVLETTSIDPKDIARAVLVLGLTKLLLEDSIGPEDYVRLLDNAKRVLSA